MLCGGSMVRLLLRAVQQCWEVTEADLKPGCWVVKWDREENRTAVRKCREQKLEAACASTGLCCGLSRVNSLNPTERNCSASWQLWHSSPLDSCNVLVKHPYWGFIFYHLPCYFLYSLLDSWGDADRISQKHSQRKYFSDQGWKVEEGFWAGVGKERTVMLA